MTLKAAQVVVAIKQLIFQTLFPDVVMIFNLFLSLMIINTADLSCLFNSCDINFLQFHHHHKACPEAWPCRTTHFQASLFVAFFQAVYPNADSFQTVSLKSFQRWQWSVEAIFYWSPPCPTVSASLTLRPDRGYIHGGSHYQFGVGFRL